MVLRNQLVPYIDDHYERTASWLPGLEMFQDAFGDTRNVVECYQFLGSFTPLCDILA